MNANVNVYWEPNFIVAVYLHILQCIRNKSELVWMRKIARLMLTIRYADREKKTIAEFVYNLLRGQRAWFQDENRE